MAEGTSGRAHPQHGVRRHRRKPAGHRQAPEFRRHRRRSTCKRCTMTHGRAWLDWCPHVVHRRMLGLLRPFSAWLTSSALSKIHRPGVEPRAGPGGARGDRHRAAGVLIYRYLGCSGRLMTGPAIVTGSIRNRPSNEAGRLKLLPYSGAGPCASTSMIFGTDAAQVPDDPRQAFRPLG